MFESDLHLRAGTRLGRFKILRSLGKGGMGAVYYAQDTLLGTNVALKILAPELSTSEGFERFRREALLARQVTHASICRIFDLHEEQGTFFISMEYVDGPTLLKVLQDASMLTPELAVDILRQVCSAVGAAHAADILHRDLKPANIIVRGRARISILDFGLSTATNMARITQAGSAMGTVHYMPPEVLQGESASKQSDIYSAGVILYQCVTGRLPFDGIVFLDLQHDIVSGRVAPPQQINPSISAELQRVIQTAMAVKPAQRFASMDAFGQALSQLQTAGRLQSGKVPPPLSPKLAEYFPSAGLPVEPIAPPAATPAPAAALSSDFATEAVSSQPGVLSSDFATEAVVPRQSVASNEVVFEPSAPRKRRGGWLLAGLLVLVGAVGVVALDLVLRDSGGLLALLQGRPAALDAAAPVADAAAALVVARAADAAPPVAVDAATPAADAPPDVGAEPDAAAEAVDGRGRPRRKPGRGKVRPDTKPLPPLPGDEREAKKSAQRRVMELFEKINQQQSATGIAKGDNPTFDQAMRELKRAKRKQDYDAALRHGQRALDALGMIRIDRDFVKPKLSRFNKLSEEREEDWVMELSVRINSAWERGDYAEANRLLTRGIKRLQQ